jgi:hypothetical protein
VRNLAGNQFLEQTFSEKKLFCILNTSMGKSETPDYLETYKEELIGLLHKSQDSFEKQLSYLSAGSLALSIGFIKDVIKNIGQAECKWLLSLGWVLLGITLLANCISHIRAAGLHNRTIKEINDGVYNQQIVFSRYKEISLFNWISVLVMVVGIAAIILFVIINIYNE